MGKRRDIGGAGMSLKAIIDGVTYGQDKISYCKVYNQLYEDGFFQIGTAPSAQIDISLIDPYEISRGAKIELFNDDNPQGVFFIDTRETTDYGELSIHGYDSMLKAEEVWLNDSYSDVAFPMSEDDAVNDICLRMGITRDPSLTLNNRFTIDYPVDEEGDLTMREILCGIAGANWGSFIISYDGKLKLVRVTDRPPETNYLINEEGYNIVFGGVRILV